MVFLKKNEDRENIQKLKELEEQLGQKQEELALVEEQLESAKRESDKYKDKMEEYYHKLLLYEVLAERYRLEIEETESKSISDMKQLVNPNNYKVLEIIKSIRQEAGVDATPIKLCEAVYNYTKYIYSVPNLSIGFWPSISEMISSGVADYESKAVLLCTLIRSIPVDARMIVVELTNGSNIPLVLLNIENKCILLDPNNQHDFYRYQGSKDQVISDYVIEDGIIKIRRVLYEFNDIDYTSYD